MKKNYPLSKINREKKMFSFAYFLVFILLSFAVNVNTKRCILTSECSDTDPTLACDIFKDTCLKVLDQPCFNSSDCVNNLVCGQSNKCECQVNCIVLLHKII